MPNIMAGRLNDLVNLINNEILHQHEDQLENTTTPLNIGSLIVLRDKLDTLIRLRENLNVEDYFINQDICPHDNFENC